MVNNLEWIDLHHHILPDIYVKSLEKIGITEISGVPFPKWTPKQDLKEMDKLGIDKAVLSLPFSGVCFKDEVFSRTLARQINTYMYDLIKKHPLRYGGFASLPLENVDGALMELEYALDELHLDGVTLLSNYKGIYLGDSELEELFAELNRRRTVVFVHPNDPPFADMNKPEVLTLFIEWPFDTTRAVANMVYNGVLDRYPNIKFVLSHGGGAVPYLAWRISVLNYRQRNKTKVVQSAYDFMIRKHGPKAGLKLLKKMYYDTTAVSAPSSLRTLKELVDPSHIVLGTDLGMAPSLMASSILRDLRAFDGFDNDDLRKIANKGALELFPRLSSL